MVENDLSQCEKCSNNTLIKLYEVDHTRMHFCLECGEQHLEYIRKPITCEHEFNEDSCILCGYSKKIKYV